MLISTLVDSIFPGFSVPVWQYMLISTLVDKAMDEMKEKVWQYMLISTLVDFCEFLKLKVSDSIC